MYDVHVQYYTSTDKYMYVLVLRLFSCVILVLISLYNIVLSTPWCSLWVWIGGGKGVLGNVTTMHYTCIYAGFF